MRIRIIIKVICIATVTFLTTGCLTTTQKGVIIGTGVGTATGTMVGTFTDNTTMGAALGAGAGAVGGILVSNHLDKESEEQVEAAIYRQLELEKQKISESDKQYVKSLTKSRLPKIPPGHMPPRGKCRIWYSGRPPGHQPPSDDCDVLEGHVPPGAWLIRG